MERLWKVAWCFFDERTQKHKAHEWVEERLRRLLEGKVDAVIRGMRYQATQRGLKDKSGRPCGVRRSISSGIEIG